MVEVRTFDGDFEEVHQLIKASWSEEYRIKKRQPVMDYSSVEFLRWNLQRPNIDPDLIMAAYSKGKLVSFVAAIPLTLKYNDQILKGGVSSFFTTHVDFQRKGIAKTLAKDGLKRGVEKGYDLGYLITDAGHQAINLVKDISKDLELKFVNFYKFTFLAKPLDKKKILQLSDLPIHQKFLLPIVTAKSQKISLKSYQFDLEKDASSIYQMFRDSCPPDALCVDWPEDELSYNLKSNLSNTFYLNFEDKKAFINYYNIDILSGKSSVVAHKNTIIDYVYFNNLSIFEKRKFVRDFCLFEKQNGSCSIIIPTLPIFDLKPFYLNLFFPSGRYHYIVGHDIKKKLQEPINIGYLFMR
jgi:predicted N-acetyltransferase YhbS